MDSDSYKTQNITQMDVASFFSFSDTMILTKISKSSAGTGERHFFLSSDITHCYWCDPKVRDMRQGIKESTAIAVSAIQNIEAGNCVPILRREKAGVPIADASRSFAISTAKKDICFEAESEAQRDKVVFLLQKAMNFNR